MELAHDVDAVPDRLANLAERLETGLQILRRYVATSGSDGEGVERPDFHRSDAHVEQRPGEVGRMSGKRYLIFVGAHHRSVAARCRNEAPGSTGLVIEVARASVVDAYLLARQASQQVVHRTTYGFPQQVP